MDPLIANKWRSGSGCCGGIGLSDVSGLLRRIPCFIVVISCIDVSFHYAAGEATKRWLMFDVEGWVKWWGFLTYMIVHKDSVHLFLNVAIQGISGAVIEREQGTLRCGAVYFCGGLAGALGTLAFSPPVLLAGASAGIYALVTAQFSNITLNQDVVKHVKYRVGAVLLVIFCDIVHVSVHIWIFKNENPRIEWVAHASGAVAGLLMGFVVFSGNFKFRKRIQVLCFLTSLVVVSGCCIYYKLRSLSRKRSPMRE